MRVPHSSFYHSTTPLPPLFLFFLLPFPSLTLTDLACRVCDDQARPKDELLPADEGRTFVQVQPDVPSGGGVPRRAVRVVLVYWWVSFIFSPVYSFPCLPFLLSTFWQSQLCWDVDDMLGW